MLKSALTLLAGVVGVVFFIDLAGRLVDRDEEKIGLRIPPFRVTVQPKDPVAWRQPQTIELVSAKLEELGYDAAGDFVVPEVPWMKMRGFCHLAQNVAAAVYESPTGKSVIAELMVNLEDGTELTAGNVPDIGFERPPFNRHEPFAADLASDPDAVKHFHAFLVGHSNAVPRVPVSNVTQFATLFEADWAREMDWRVQRRDLSVEEMRDIYRSAGITNASDTLLSITRLNWRRGMDRYAGRSSDN